MDPSIVVSVILGVASILLGINAFFLRNLVVKIEFASISAITNNVKLEMLQKQMEDISKMREDVAGLKFAITGYLQTKERNESK